VKIGRQKGAKNKAKRPRKKGASKRSRNPKNNKYSSDDESTDSTSDDDSDKDDEETETEDDDDDDDDDQSDTNEKSNRKVSVSSPSHRKRVSQDEDSPGSESTSSDDDNVDYFLGCIPLSKPDDPHWLSGIQCFVRSSMVEVFSLTEEDTEEEDDQYDDAEIGQVGIRCKFCAILQPKLRPKGYVYFPDSISNIYQCVADLQRRHLTSCPEIPEDTKKFYKTQRGFASKAEGETQQYWIDSARELGLIDVIENGGIRFFRDPMANSLADDIAKERSGYDGRTSSLYNHYDKMSLVRPSDRSVATDHVVLLLHQVRPCRFKNSDRRGGPGSRGRDRALGYPGIACIHCSTKNNFGRYFPVASKSLADNTVNSIMSHIYGCSRCPEAVKASLVYLSHRSILQKVELGGGWKKTYFKMVWDRLHIERAWVKKDANDGGVNIAEESIAEAIKEKGDDESGNESGIGSDMEDMVKAAATWLTDRDAGNGATQTVRTRGGRGRGPMGGRGLPCRYGRGRGGTVKRRRVLI